MCSDRNRTTRSFRSAQERGWPRNQELSAVSVHACTAYKGCRREGDWRRHGSLGGGYKMESVKVYAGMLAAIDQVSGEAAILAEQNKQIRKYNMTLKQLHASFDQVQSRLVRVAAIKPGLSKTIG